MGPVPCCSPERKTEYQKRPIIERYFNSGERSRLLDTHRDLNIEKVSLHMMSMLGYMATALAQLQADDEARMRHMKIRLPAAAAVAGLGPRPSRPACRDPDCNCCARWREAA